MALCATTHSEGQRTTCKNWFPPNMWVLRENTQLVRTGGKWLNLLRYLVSPSDHTKDHCFSQNQGGTTQEALLSCVYKLYIYLLGGGSGFASIWRWKNNSQKLELSSHQVASGNWTQVIRLEANTFTHWAILWALICSENFGFFKRHRNTRTCFYFNPGCGDLGLLICLWI